MAHCGAPSVNARALLRCREACEGERTCRGVKLWVEVYSEFGREFIQSCGSEVPVNVNAQSAFTVAVQLIAYSWRERYERQRSSRILQRVRRRLKRTVPSYMDSHGVLPFKGSQRLLPRYVSFDDSAMHK